MTISYPGATDEKLDGDALRATFDAASALTVGLEEEALLLDPETLDLLPRAPRVIERCGGDPRFKLELPASQLEIVLPPTRTVAESAAALARARRELATAASGVGRLAAAGTHPFAPPLGELNGGERYEAIVREYGSVASMQQVAALQVHVAVPDHARALAVYNALRSHLPELAALAANAPFYAGVDSGLASVRPKISELLPRQGVPPALESWDAFAAVLARVPATQWWWELRPHHLHGTLELRVPDAQATVADAAAVSGFAQSLVAWLADRHDGGDLPGPEATWRIEESRWAACRSGLDGVLADPVTGERVVARELLAGRLEALAPHARALRCEAELADVARLLDANGAERQRAEGGPREAAAWLASVYEPASAG